MIFIPLIKIMSTATSFWAESFADSTDSQNLNLNEVEIKAEYRNKKGIFAVFCGISPYTLIKRIS